MNKVYRYGPNYFLVKPNISILPAGKKPDEIIDVSKATEKEIATLQVEPSSQKILKKYKDLTEKET